MTNTLTTWELASMRGDIKSLTMPDTGVILAGTLTIDGMGGATTAWGTAVANVACRMDFVKGVKPVAGGVLQPFTGLLLTVPYDTPLTTANRFLYNGDQYNVISVTSGSWMLELKAEVEKV